MSPLLRGSSALRGVCSWLLGRFRGTSAPGQERRCAEPWRGLEGLEARVLLSGTGLTGSYYDNSDFTSLKLTRSDAVVDFNWAAGSPDASIGADTFSVRWTGQVQPLLSEMYTFQATSDDGVRLWVNRQLVIDDWTNHTAADNTGQIALRAGERYDIRLEYYENTGNAAVRLSWSSPSQAEQVIPQGQLYPTSAPDDRGSILQETWTGVPGDSISVLTFDPNYPAKPDGREYLTAFESFQADWADDYGDRVRGFLHPQATGSYVLAVAGDEQTELYLSSDADPANKTLIAYSTLPTGFREFTKCATQLSAPISLVAGQKYYVEALHKEGTGGDHFSVGWQEPGASVITVIPGDALSPFGTDLAEPAQGSILATLAQGRPRLLSTPERFEWASQQIAAGGQVQSWYNSILASATGYLDDPLPAYTPDNRGTILSVSRSVVDHIYKLALVYRIGGDARYAERAWDELNAAANFPDWHPAHFLDTAEMTHAFGIGYDWLYDYWTPDRRSVISNAIVTKGLNQALPLYRANSSWVASSSNNWNLVCNGGMVIGALALGDEQAALVEEILAKAVPSAAAVMRHFTADNGGWYEGPGYWDYSTSYNARMMAALEAALGSDFGLGRIPGVSETGDYPLYETGPGKLSFNYADAGAGNMKGPQLFWYARRYNRPVYAWYERANASASPLDVLWYDPRGADPQSDAMTTDSYFRGDVSAYKDAEAVTLRTAWGDANATFVGFKAAGKNGDSHGHLDVGSFVLDALGKRWAYDLGGDDYALPDYFGSKRWTYYRLRAEGHNTLVINPGSGADQVVGSMTQIVRFDSGADESLAIADTTAAYSGVTRAWRGIRISRIDGSMLVQDEIEAATPADVWWFMHVKLDPTQIQISPDGTSAMLTQGSARLWMKIVSTDGAQFSLMDPVPLPTSPNPSGQNANAGYKKLAIHLTSVTSRRLAVWMVPLTSGESPPLALPTLSPLASWQASSGEQVWLGDIDEYARQTGDDVYVDPAWGSEVAAATGLPVAGFDVSADNQAVPFTFNFTVPAGQYVTGASLALGVKSTGGDTSTDRLYLDGMTNSFLYSALGWAALTTAPTARTVDLSSQLALLQDGWLNVAVQHNTAVDWAVLTVRLAPTGQYSLARLYPQADAYVRDGTYANQNFGTGNLMTKKDSGAGYNRESYLRFDLSGVTGAVASAAVRLAPVSLGMAAENQAAFVSDDTWSESGITWNSKPSSGAQFASWTTVVLLAVQFDVTSLVQDALAGDKKLSLRVFSTTSGSDYWVQYASREYADPAFRPQLLITTLDTSPAAVLQVDGDRDAPGQDDGIRVVADSGSVSAFINNDTGIPDIRRDRPTLQQVIIDGLGGNDTLTVDFSGGSPVPPGGFTYDGGDGSDTLAVSGAGGATMTATQVAYGSSIVAYGGVEYGSFDLGAGLTLSGATLTLGADGAISPGTDVTIDGGGTLDLNGHSDTVDVLTLVNGSIINGTLTGTSYAVQSGTISAGLGGSAAMTKSTSGKVILSGASAYTGSTTIREGILNVRSAGALGVGGSVGLSMDAGAGRYAALELEGGDFTIDGKPLTTSGSGIGGAGAVHNISGSHVWTGPVSLGGGGGGSTYQCDAGTLTFTNTVSANTTSRSLTLQGAGNFVFGGGIQNGSTVALPFTKKGSGTATLNGANTYTGATTVSAGTLLVNGSLAGGAVSVSSGATLGGTGAIGGTVTVSSGGAIAPAAPGAAGTLTAGSLTLSSGSILNFEIASPGADRINVTSALTVNGGKVNVSALGPVQVGTYTLIDYAGTLGGSFGNLSLGATPAGLTCQLVNNIANTSINLAVTGNPPTVTAVQVGSTAWSSSFLGALGGSGYAIPAGAGQLSPLPWSNVDQVKIAFSEDVSVSQGDLTVRGVNVTQYAFATSGFSYDGAAHVATWTLAGPVAADKLLLVLADSVKDTAGNKLDGEWTDTVSVFPSGSGAAGGAFRFRLNVLPGDVNQNGYVQSADGLVVRGGLGSSVGSGSYSIFKDINGNGYIQASDGLLVRGRLGGALPAGEPSLAGRGSPSSGSLAVDALGLLIIPPPNAAGLERVWKRPPT